MNNLKEEELINQEVNSGESNLVNCQFHPENRVSFILLDKTLEYQVGCINCLIEHQYPSNRLVSLESILKNQARVKNWPPFQDRTLKNLSEFINKFGQDEQEQNEIQLVINYFSEVKKEINGFICKIEKEIITNIVNLNSELTGFMSKIQDQNKLEQLKQILMDNQNDYSTLNSKFKCYFDDYIDTLKKNEEDLVKESTQIIEKLKIKQENYESQKTFISNIIFNEKFYDISQFLSKISSEIHNISLNEKPLPIKVKSTIKDGDFNLVQHQSHTLVQATQMHMFYVDHLLDHEKKYEITIKNLQNVDDEENQPQIKLGLTNGFNTKKIISELNVQNYRNYNMSGVYGPREVKVQIWLENKVFRFNIDGKFYGGFENWETYKSFETYYFAVINFKNSNINLCDFKEVTHFQEW